jgi:hypothetical protein
MESQKHARLLSFNSKTVMSVDDIVAADTTFIKEIYSEKFNPKTDTIAYRDDLIYISYLSIVNGCANYDGNLKFKSDSVLLELDDISDSACTEPRCDRLIYQIQNPERKRYKIQKW